MDNKKNDKVESIALIECIDQIVDKQSADMSINRARFSNKVTD